MHTDQEILAALRAHLDQDQLAAVLDRLLRVQEAWVALHNPAFLDEVVTAVPTADLTPSHLASLSMGGSLHSEMTIALAKAHSVRARQVWEEAEVGITVRRDLLDTALLGSEFSRRYDADPEGLIQRAADSPTIWGSPIAIAWMSFSDPEALLGVLLERRMAQLAIQIALSNLPAGKAAAFLTRNANGSTVPMLQQITRAGESDLASSLSASVHGGQDQLSQLLIEAIARQSKGEHPAARNALHEAWEKASETAAQVAEFTADQARQVGDPVTELEANRRALELLPSSQRRARTAMSLIELERNSEALSLISGNDLSVEERIAVGLAQSQSGDARPILNSALAGIDGSLEEDWFSFLTDGLITADDWAAAVESAQTWVTHYPASAKARIKLAQALFEAGGPENAEQQAAVGLALRPHSEKARKLLAQLQHDPSEALEHSRQLASIEATELAAYAIAAGEHEFAANTIEDLPANPKRAVLEGKMLQAGGEPAAAISKFEDAIQKAPGNAEAYQALAAAHREDGDEIAEQSVLTEAIQANPKEVSLRLSHVKSLRADGKVSEALNAAAEAWELDEKNVPVGLEYADLLCELGHVDRALEVLRHAALRQPLSWQVGLAMAKTYERRGDMSSAAQALRTLPSSAPPEASFHSGRILLKSGTDTTSALHLLEVAESGGWAESSLDYWFGRALEQEERYEEALERYDRAQNSSDYEVRLEAVLGSARVALGMEQVSKALAGLEFAQSSYPRSARILAAMSDAYIFAKLPEKALEVAEHAVELDPEETRAWHALGDSLASAGDFRGAVNAIEKLSALDPGATEGWLTLARLASKAGDQRVQRRSIAEAIWRGRRNAEVLHDAAQALEQSGNVHSAVNVMKAATRTRPEDPRLISSLAKIQESAGDYQGAFESWQASIALSPSEPESLRRSAACAQKLGMDSQSTRLLETAVAIEPQNPWLRRDLAKAYLEQGQARQGLDAYANAVKAAPNDETLACEAAEASLLSGNPRHALGLLRTAQVENGRSQAATAEAFILLDKQEQAAASLSEALNQGYESARVYSMMSVTTSRHTQAIEYLERARSIPLESAHEAIWLSRAEAKLFYSSEAIEVLGEWEGDPFVIREKAHVALRLRDMLWLLDLSDTVSSLDEASIASLAQSSVEAMHERNLADTAHELWLSVVESPARLAEFVDTDPLGWIGEAVALAYLKSDQLSESREALEQVKFVRSQSEWHSILDGMIHEASGRAEDARAAYRSHSTPITNYLLGRAYERARSLERAATHIGTAVLGAPEQHGWQHKLASIYLEMGDEDSALAHFQTAVAGDPENSEYLLSLARAYSASGHLNQAVEGYTSALAFGTDTVEAHREAGQVALQLGLHGQATAWFERAITLSPNDVDSLIGSAKASIAGGDQQLADERLQIAMQQAPGDVRVLLGVGHVRAGSGDHRAAMMAFEEALQAGAAPSKVRRGESKVLVQQGKHKEAAEAMQEVLQSTPDDHRLWYELAETLEAGAELAEADRAVSEAIRIAPANPEYRLGLGRISRKSGNLDRAIEELRQAENTDPDDARIPVEAGLVYEDRREYTRALDAYLKAVEIDPDSLQAHYRAGLLLRTLKAYRKAGEMLKRASDLAPTDQDVMHQLAAVRALELVHG